jgi:hypothetical protein
MAGWDCSGLVLEILKAVGVVPSKYDATSHVLYTKTLSGGIPEPRAHALAFYGKGNIATHIAYCVSPTHMVEAGSGNVLTTNLEAAIKQNAFVRVRPIYGRKDFLACHMPDKSHFV